MITEFNNQKKLTLSKNLKVGMNLFLENGFCEITNIKTMVLDDKYILITEDGTVISSGIFSSTICDSDIDENLSFDENLKKWKTKHNFISLIKDKPQ